nr:hypothetical protein [Brevibacillus composti]
MNMRKGGLHLFLELFLEAKRGFFPHKRVLVRIGFNLCAIQKVLLHRNVVVRDELADHRFKQFVHERFHAHAAKIVQGTEVRLLHRRQPHGREVLTQQLFNTAAGINLL